MIAALAAILSGACSQPGTMQLRMEVGYPLLTPHADRVWAALSMPQSAVTEIQLDEPVAVRLECTGDICSASKVFPVSAARGDGLFVEGRYARNDERTGEALIVLDGFPVPTSSALANQLKFEKGKRKFVTISYSPNGGGAKFAVTELHEVREGQALVWK